MSRFLHKRSSVHGMETLRYSDHSRSSRIRAKLLKTIKKSVIIIESSGVATGRIGQAVFNDCIIHRNRGWLGRKLNLKTDFIVLGGYMEGKITPKDEGKRREFTIPLNIVNGKLTGTIMLLPKFPLTRPLKLEKSK